MANSRLSQKYIPHLANLQAVCEANYVRLMTLLPEVNDDSLSYQFESKQGDVVKVTVQRCAPYTTTLSIALLQSALPEPWRPSMDVQMYHDARMAEVLSFQRMNRFRSSYTYPNRLMHQKNEKELVNLFLAEWLINCLQNQSARV